MLETRIINRKYPFLSFRINADLEAKQKSLPKIFKGYKSLLVPQDNATEPVKVTLGLTLKMVVSLDQKNQVFSTIGYLYMVTLCFLKA